MSKQMWILCLGSFLLSLPCIAEDVEKSAIELAESLAGSESQTFEINDDMIEELLGLEFDDDEDEDDMSDAVVFGDDDFDDEEEFS